MGNSGKKFEQNRPPNLMEAPPARATDGPNLARRRFLRDGVLGAGMMVAPWPLGAAAGPQQAAPAASTSEPWYRHAYRRSVVDIHITDWNDEFLSKLDPVEYVRMLKLAGAQSTVLYSQSHTGLTNYPTKVGRQHRAMVGKDLLHQLIDGCRRNQIGVQLYYSVIFDRWAFDQRPDWRIKTVDGRDGFGRARHGILCPNSPYRDYVVAMAHEICAGYDFEGSRFDMTFWPEVCYCRYCQKRFADEVGGELPRTVNWEDARWAAFQRKREEWLVEFARLLTSTVKKLKPRATVEHQASTYPLNWKFGVMQELARTNDFLQGDFYGGALQGSFVRKLLYNLTENLPFGFETSAMVALQHHTAKKSTDLLRAKAYAGLADGGAFIFIDGIDPVGTLNESVYRRMGEIFSETQRYDKYLGGKPCRDVGIYFSMESKCSFADNGKAPNDPMLAAKMPHIEATLNWVKACIVNHIPFGIATRKHLDQLAQHKVVVLPNVLMMDEEEVSALREYVRAGGNIYASKHTSLITKVGVRKPNFMLSDVFGCSWDGETRERYTYIAPAEKFSNLFPEYSLKYPVGMDATQMKLRIHPGAETVGTLVLPYSDPVDPDRFSSIHSNPPGIATGQPAVVLNHFGKGKVVYVAGEIEGSDLDLDILAGIIRYLYNEFTFEAVAPPPVEITAFRQEDRKRLLINCVNFQDQLPNIPVEGITMKVRLGGRKPRQLLLLPEEKKLPYRVTGNLVEFTVPRLETFRMLALDFA